MYEGRPLHLILHIVQGTEVLDGKSHAVKPVDLLGLGATGNLAGDDLPQLCDRMG